MLKINKQSIVGFFFSLIFILILLEKVYMPEDDITGSMNRIIIGVLFIFGIIYRFYRGTMINLIDISMVLSIGVYIFLWKYSGDNSFIYMMMIFILYLIKDIEIYKEKFFFSCIIFIGFIMGVVQKIEGEDRVTGFLNTSPTIFSYILLIAMIYVLSSKGTGKNLLISLLAIITIYFTGSRSTLICSILFFLYFLLKIYMKKSKFFKVSLFMGIGIPLITFLLFNLKTLSTFEIREGSEYSTQARTSVLEHFFGELMENTKMLLIGKGGGYATYETPRILGLPQDYYPLHQDIVMWIVEYGILGIILLSIIHIIINSSIKLSNEKKICMFILFIIGTFHNIFISPICLILIKILYNSLERE